MNNYSNNNFGYRNANMNGNQIMHPHQMGSGMNPHMNAAYGVNPTNNSFGYTYAANSQYHAEVPQYHQQWYGYSNQQPNLHQAQQCYVDVTKASKINYDDDDDDDDDDDEQIDTQKGNQVLTDMQSEESPSVSEQNQIKQEEKVRKRTRVERAEPVSDERSVIESSESEEEDEKEGDIEEEDEGSRLEKVSSAETVSGEAQSVVCIPGTSIVLKTEEDIKLWREERRKMWLVKISNKKDVYREQFNIKDDAHDKNPFQEQKKERNFLQNIQNQVKRVNPKPNLTIGLHQRALREENAQILDFIKELGDADLIKYELSEEEKTVLFGGNDRRNNNITRSNSRYDRRTMAPRENSSNRNNSKKRPFDRL